MTKNASEPQYRTLGSPGKAALYIGLMSGTSLDGIDVALIETDGVSVKKRLGFKGFPYEPEQRAMLGDAIATVRHSNDPLAIVMGQVYTELSDQLADWHATAVEQFLASLSDLDRAQIAAIGFHGQTLDHRPDDGITIQLGNAQRLASTLGIPVVGDFRKADVNNGGQGAPLAPLYHAALLNGAETERALGILNIGGVANLTVLERDPAKNMRITAFDTGPGNGLIDDWVARHTSNTFDQDGRLGAAGTVNDTALDELLAHPYVQAPYPKSLDRHDFDLTGVIDLSLEEGAATLTAFTAESVNRSIGQTGAVLDKVYVTGGGRHNPTLMTMLRDRTGMDCQPIESLGVNGDAVEAEAFAFLAARHLRELPLSWPETTGCKEPTVGGKLFHS